MPSAVIFLTTSGAFTFTFTPTSTTVTHHDPPRRPPTTHSPTTHRASPTSQLRSVGM